MGNTLCGSAIDAFKQRIVDHLLPEFCTHKSRGWDVSGFKQDWSRVSEADASDFLKGLDSGLIRHVGRGQYCAAICGAKEQFFWSGSKKKTPRPIYLWMEPIITVAALTRLHFEYGWPRNLIGSQSKDYAFDVAAVTSIDSSNEHIACEVKKTELEIQRLVTMMQDLAARNVTSESDLTKHQINAYRKLNALRERKAPVFWALGPNRTGQIFQMSYENGEAHFHSCGTEALAHIGRSPSCDRSLDRPPSAE